MAAQLVYMAILCHTPRGSSTVDYAVISKQLYDNIQYLKIHNLTHISDHCSMSVSMQINEIDQPKMNCSIKLSPLPPKYIWNVEV